MMNPETVTTDARPPINRGQMFIGIVVLLVGAAFLLDQMRMIEIGHAWRYWPFLIIAMGVKRLLDEPVRGGLRRGWFMILVGTLLALDQFRILSMNRSWPLFVVAFGVSLIRQALGRAARTRTSS